MFGIKKINSFINEIRYKTTTILDDLARLRHKSAELYSTWVGENARLSKSVAQLTSELEKNHAEILEILNPKQSEPVAKVGNWIYMGEYEYYLVEGVIRSSSEPYTYAYLVKNFSSDSEPEYIPANIVAKIYESYVPEAGWANDLYESLRNPVPGQ